MEGQCNVCCWWAHLGAGMGFFWGVACVSVFCIWSCLFQQRLMWSKLQYRCRHRTGVVLVCTRTVEYDAWTTGEAKDFIDSLFTFFLTWETWLEKWGAQPTSARCRAAESHGGVYTVTCLRIFKCPVFWVVYAVHGDKGRTSAKYLLRIQHTLSLSLLVQCVSIECLIGRFSCRLAGKPCFFRDWRWRFGGSWGIMRMRVCMSFVWRTCGSYRNHEPDAYIQ